MSGPQKRSSGKYTRFVVNYPWIIVVLDVLVVAVCTPIVLWQHGWSILQEPSKGFEPRGTDISGQQLAMAHLRVQMENGSLRSGHRPAHAQSPVTPGYLSTQLSSPGMESPRPTLTNIECLLEPVPEHGQSPRIVFELSGGDLSSSHLRELCELEEAIVEDYWGEPCGDWSLSHAVASLLGKSCFLITDADVEDVMARLQTCRAAYFSHNAPLQPFCHQDHISQFSSSSCDGLPWECVENNAVYNILHYFTDAHFLSSENKTRVRYTTIFLPASAKHQPAELRDFFLTTLNSLKPQPSDIVKLAGMELNINVYMFQYQLLQDLPFFGLAAGLVTLLMLLYMRSVVLVLTILLVMAFTVVVTYFLYFVVFRLTFFPFLNLLALVVLLAKGSCDAFVLCDLWGQGVRHHRKRAAKTQGLLGEPGVLEAAMAGTLRGSAPAVAVSGFCGAGALLAGLISHIPAIRCYAVFAGTCVVVNLCFSLTLLPAVCVMTEMVAQSCYEACPATTKHCLLCCAKLTACWRSCWRSVGKCITFLWPVWFALTLALGIGGVMVVFFLPGLSLPTSLHAQLYTDAHPFEVYRQTLQPQLRFERSDNQQFDISFIWGLHSRDTGHYMDPDLNVPLTFDPEFDPYTPDSQQFAREFCRDLKTLDIVLDEVAQAPCFMDVWMNIVEGECRVEHDGIEFLLDPCCRLSFPLNVTMARLCLANNLVLGYLDRRFGNSLGDVLLDSQNQIRVLQYNVKLTKRYTTEYGKTKEVYHKLEKFLTDELAKAPNGLTNGWFASRSDQFALYDLQECLMLDTLIIVGASLAWTWFVLLLASCNIILASFAMVTILFINAVTVGALVLYGWELDALESVGIVTSVSLSIPFTVHFAIAFGKLKSKSRRVRALDVTANIASAVTIAALVIFVGGAALYPGKIFAFQRLGLVLMLITSTSWAFALFFFLSLCRGVGPSGYCGDLRCKEEEQEDVLNQHNQQNVKIKPMTPVYRTTNGETMILYPSELYRRGPYVAQYHGALVHPTTTLDRSRQSRVRRSWYEQSRLPRLRLNQVTGSVRGETCMENGWI